MVKKKFVKFSILFFFISLFNTKLTADTEKSINAIELVQRSENAYKIIASNKELKNIEEFLKKGKAIMIFPEIYEGGLFFGAKAGNGVLLIRNNNSWSGPFFYTLGGVSFGLQVGVKSGKVVFVVMTDKGLQSIVKQRVKFGVDVDAAIANQGIGYSAESTIKLADIYSFSDNSGLFIGGSFEGTYVQPRNDINRTFYNKEFTSDEIINNFTSSINASDLVNTLNNYKK